MRTPRSIADYALIGNTQTAALVSKEGSVDWFCWPRFDSGAVLCRLLDADRGGYLSVKPSAPFDVSRAYEEDSNILRTTFTTASGVLAVTALMPVGEAAEDHHKEAHWLAQKVECLAGHIDVEVRFRPTFDFALAETTLTVVAGGAVASGGCVGAALLCPARLHPGPDGDVRGSLQLRAGQSEWVLLSMGGQVSEGAVHIDRGALERALHSTRAYWKKWSGQLSYDGVFASEVRRGALVLKALTFSPSGAVVAAPTTSLPEDIGGVRNWDYRYSWLRDSALVVYALQRLGLHDEAMAYWGFLERLPGADDAPLRIMYAVDGTSDLQERELPLSGFAGSRPVRVGNGAWDHRQHDIYGEVLDAADFCQREMGHQNDDAFWRLVRRFAEGARARWRQPDRGIWEVRGPERHFTHSKVMCWVALDRAAKIAGRLGHHDARRSWAAEARLIHEDVLRHGFDQSRGAFTQSYGSTQLDATALLLPVAQLLPAEDPRLRSTVKLIRSELTDNGLVRRYQSDDGLPGNEGAFVLCTAWLSSALSLQGQVDDAERALERVVACANDVGLMSEEVTPGTGELLGNFPQAFSHLGLIRAALLLEHAKSERRRPRPMRSLHRASNSRTLKGAFSGSLAAAALQLFEGAESLLLRAPPVYSSGLVSKRLFKDSSTACRWSKRALLVRAGYGALLGALFGATRSFWPRKVVLAGLAFGAAIASFEALAMPAVGATPPLSRWRRAERYLLPLHASAYALAAAASVSRLQQRSRR